MRPTPSHVLALALGAACATLVACGGGGDEEALIPDARASAMVQELDRIDRAVRTGDCEAVGGTVSRLQDEVNSLPNRVDAGLRDRLQEGVANLADLAPEECQDGGDEDPTETTETTTTTETVPTETVPPETTETEPPPVETTETEPVPPPETTPTPPETEPPPTETIPPDTGGAEVPPAGEPGDTGGATPTP